MRSIIVIGFVCQCVFEGFLVLFAAVCIVVPYKCVCLVLVSVVFVFVWSVVVQIVTLD